MTLRKLPGALLPSEVASSQKTSFPAPLLKQQKSMRDLIGFCNYSVVFKPKLVTGINKIVEVQPSMKDVVRDLQKDRIQLKTTFTEMMELWEDGSKSMGITSEITATSYWYDVKKNEIQLDLYVPCTLSQGKVQKIVEYFLQIGPDTWMGGDMSVGRDQDEYSLDLEFISLTYGGELKCVR